MRISAAILAVSLLSSVACVDATNPFDPETPAAQQATAAVAGTVRLADTTVALPSALDEEAAQLRVVLTVEDRDAVDSAGAVLSVGLTDVVDGAGRFNIVGVPPGRYALRIDNVGTRFSDRPPLSPFDVFAGERLNVGELQFRYAPAPGEGVGVIRGRVDVEGAGGPRTVRLFQLGTDETVEVRALQTDGNGAFRFSTGIGTFAVVGELSGFVPDYALDLTVGEAAGQALEYDLSGDAALVLQPITALLFADVTPIEGQRYVSGDVVDVNAAAFGGVQRMRLSAAGDLAAQPFVEYAARVPVALPDVQGLVTIEAQFERTSEAGFVFVSPTFTTTVVRDTTPPRLDRVDVPSAVRGSDGARYVAAGDDDVSVDVTASDDHSAIHRLLVAQPDDNTLPDLASAAFSPVFSPGGAAFFSPLVELTPGEGAKEIFVVAADRAGNLSLPTQLSLVRDTVAPALTLQLAEAVGAAVVSRAINVSVVGVVDGDAPVAMRIGSPLSPAVAFEPFGTSRALTLLGGHDDVVTVDAEFVDAAGNVGTATTGPLRLSLLGRISGTVELESAAGAALGPTSVQLLRGPRDARGVVATAVVDNGAFVFDAVPEDSGYVVRVAHGGFVDVDVSVGAVLDDDDLDVGAVALPLARGGARGRFLRADRSGEADAHGLIAVRADLLGSARAFTTTTLTDDSGAFTFANLPALIAGELYRFTASAEGYSRAEASTTLVTRDAAVVVDDGFLAPVSGEFDICAPSGVCTPLAFSNQNSLRVRLRQTAGVTAIRTAVGAAPTGAFVPFVAGNDVFVDVSGAGDGVVSVFVQVIADGNTAPPLEATYVKDTAPPALRTLERIADAGAKDARFTNDAAVTARVSADAGLGVVAPLADVAFAFAASAPAAPPATATRCASDTLCTVALPTSAGLLVEGTQRLFAFACDAAGNCSAPASTSVIVDRTPPSALHGVAFAPTGDNVVTRGATALTRSPAFSIAVDAGIATDAAGNDVLDDTGANVADVFAYAFALAPAVRASQLEAVDVDAGDTVVVTGPALPATDGSYDVFALFVDAAGNATAIEPNPFSFDLTLDTTAPAVAFALDGGAATTRNARIAFTVTPAPGDAPETAWFTLDGGRFTTPITPAPVAFPLSAANNGVDVATNGTITVHARFFDAVGNVSERVASIRRDTNAPTVIAAACNAPSCISDGGVTFTRSGTRAVVVDTVAQDLEGAVVSLEVGINGGTRSAQPNDGAVEATLANLTTAQTVDIVAVDEAGNRSAVRSVAITFDVAPPTASVRVDAVEGSGVATAFITAADASGTATMIVSTNGVFDGPRVPVSTQVAVPLVGSRTVSVRVFDRAGNSVDAAATLPTPSLVLAGGAAVTNQTTVNAVVGASGGVGALQFVVDDVALACATASGYAALSPNPATQSVALDAVNGTKTVSACVRDSLNNSVRIDRSITLDTVPPQNAFVFVDAGAAVSLDRDVVVTVAAPADATQMAVGEGALNCATASFVAVATTANLTLAVGSAPAEGDRVVSVCLRDAAGNAARFSDGIYVDSFDPSGSVRVDVDGDAFVRSQNVTLFVENASADVATAAFANGTINCATATFQPFSTGVSFFLPAGEGAKTIAGCLRDLAGRTASVSATVTLDSVPPAAAVIVNGGAALTAVTGVNAVVNGDGGSGFGFAAAASPLDCATAAYAAFDGSEPRALTLAAPDGAKTISACVRDPAGNTALATAGIVLDRAAPDALLAECLTCNRNASNARVTNLRNHVLDVEALDDTSTVELVRLQVRAPNATTASVDVAFAATAPLALVDLDGVHDISVSFVDAAGLVSTPITFAITLDRTAPTATVALTGTPSSTLTRNQAISVQLTGASADAASLAFSNDSSFSGVVFVPFTAAALPHTLLPGDGSKQVFARVRDFAGNESANLSASITLDQAPPVAPTVVIAAGAALTRTLANTVAYAAQGATEMRVSLDGVFDTETFVPFVASRSETFAAGDGTKSVTVIYRDAAGNETAAASDTIDLDRTAPVFSSASLNGGALFTRSNSVTLTLRASGASGVRIATDGNAADEALVPFQENSTVLLPAPDGLKSVVAILEDAAGNTTAVPAATIRLDTVAPSGPQIATLPVRTTAGTTDSTSARPFPVVVGVRGSDGNGVTHEVIGGDVTGWTPIAAGGSGSFVHSFTLPSAGVFNLGVRAVDPAGNISAEDFITVVRDNTPPGAPTGLDLLGRDESIALRFTAVAGDVAGYRVFYGTGSPTSADKSDYDGAFADQGASPIDIGLNTSFVLTGLPNNSAVSIAIEAYDTTTDDGGLTGSAPNRSALSTGAAELPNPVTPREVSRVAGSGSGALFAALASRGSRVYTNLPGQTFRVYDVSDPSQPVVLASTTGFAETFSMSTWGKFAYLTNGSGSNGIRAVNVEAGRAGALTSSLFSSGANRRYVGFAPTGRFGYGAAGSDVVSTNWTLVKLQASTDLVVGTYSESSTLAVSGGGQVSCIDANARRVVAGEFADNSNVGRLRIFSTDPNATTAPTLLDTLTFDRTTVSAVRVVGRRAYVGLTVAATGGTAGLAIVDINSGFVNSTITGFSCRGVDVSGHHAYCSDEAISSEQGERLVVIDISNASNPRIVGRVRGLPGESELSAITATSSGIFGVETGGGALVGYEIVRPAAVADQANEPGNVDAVAIHGPIGYAAGFLDNGGLRVMNLVPGNTSTSATISAADLSCAGGSVLALAVQRHYLIASVDCSGFNDGLALIDMSDQFSPVVVGLTIGSGSRRRGVELYGNAVFAGTDGGNLESFRLFHQGAEAAGVVFERSVSATITPRALRVRGGVAFVQDGFGGLRSIDVSDPDNSGTMTILGSFSGAGGEDLVADGDVAFATRDADIDGIRVIDISNPAAMAVLTPDPESDNGGRAFKAAKAGRYLFVRQNVFDAGFRVLDVSDPTRMVTLNINGGVQSNDTVGLAVEGTVLLLASDTGGVNMLSLSR
jgi:hypothetical protein